MIKLFFFDKNNIQSLCLCLESNTKKQLRLNDLGFVLVSLPKKDTKILIISIVYSTNSILSPLDRLIACYYRLHEQIQRRFISIECINDVIINLILGSYVRRFTNLISNIIILVIFFRCSCYSYCCRCYWIGSKLCSRTGSISII